MNCLICRQAGAAHGLTSISLQREEMRLLIVEVPALLCPHCGEAYVSEEVAAQLLQYADRLLEDGILEKAIEYSKVRVA